MKNCSWERDGAGVARNVLTEGDYSGYERCASGSKCSTCCEGHGSSRVAVARARSAAYHDEAVRDVHASRVQCDEIWSFCYAKANGARQGKGAGDVWTWTAIEADSKLIISGRDARATAIEFMDDLRARSRVQLTTPGHKALEAVEGAFGGDVDYAQLIKGRAGT